MNPYRTESGEAADLVEDIFASNDPRGAVLALAKKALLLQEVVVAAVDRGTRLGAPRASDEKYHEQGRAVLAEGLRGHGAIPVGGALQPGTVLETTRELVFAHNNQAFPQGSRLTLIERTQAAPHGLLSPLGNWLVDGPNGRTVWSSIQALLFEGAVRPIT